MYYVFGVFTPCLVHIYVSACVCILYIRHQHWAPVLVSLEDAIRYQLLPALIRRSSFNNAERERVAGLIFQHAICMHMEGLSSPNHPDLPAVNSQPVLRWQPPSL